ncbi:MAG: sulfur oxidation c-type cytochrome SoxX [Betaproteobacteria bacterium RIFCSPLOWO2_02_64_14]|nr:MAG: sulfur oxidation c-type cytochrome SoxX [Betaproteobacteria bacterium RIFCSPLOWO2_02_64_14]
MKKTWFKWAALGVPVLVIAGCATYPDPATTRRVAEKMVNESFTAPAPALLKRLAQDKSQQICSKIGGAQLTQEEAAEVARLARASIKYPPSGKLVGDWKRGDKLAHDGAGDRIQRGRLEKRKENGGLCQNCHALAPGEINVGNVGPSLTGYGLQRGTSDSIAKLTYERIYNAWAYSPCSNMPRLGATGHLTPEQITHMVAYLIDPQSPVNKK